MASSCSFAIFPLKCSISGNTGLYKTNTSGMVLSGIFEQLDSPSTVFGLSYMKIPHKNFFRYNQLEMQILSLFFGQSRTFLSFRIYFSPAMLIPISSLSRLWLVYQDHSTRHWRRGHTWWSKKVFLKQQQFGFLELVLQIQLYCRYSGIGTLDVAFLPRPMCQCNRPNRPWILWFSWRFFSVCRLLFCLTP